VPHKASSPPLQENKQMTKSVFTVISKCLLAATDIVQQQYQSITTKTTVNSRKQTSLNRNQTDHKMVNATDYSTLLTITLTVTLIYELDFQSLRPTVTDDRSHANIRGQLVQKTEWKQMYGRIIDMNDCNTFPLSQ